MPRTTLDLDPTVLRELRRRGAREHKTMGALASELLARAMAEAGNDGLDRTLRWTSKDLGTPRIDLEDKDALHALLDEEA